MMAAGGATTWPDVSSGAVTQLLDGRVLVMADDGVWVYDPAMDKLSRKDSSAGFYPYTPQAFTLADDRVLIMVANGDATVAEIYDPVDGTRAQAGKSKIDRTSPSIAELKDGRVLIAGGAPLEGPGPASAEIYDPKTEKFTLTGSMTTPRVGARSTTLADGRVLVTGGTINLAADTPLASAEIYDPATGTFSTTGSMETGRRLHSAVLLDDGRVLVVGGSFSAQNPDAIASSAEIYDPATGKFSPTGSMSIPRGYDMVTVLRSGKVLVAGGYAKTGCQSPPCSWSSAELYDPATGTFSSTGSMLEARAGSITLTLRDGRVLVLGGTNRDGFGITTAELYMP
jgi:hypothetical protein